MICKTNNNISKQTFGLVLVLFFLCSACMSQKNPESLKEIRLDILYPVLPDGEDSLRNLYDTVWIQYLGDEVLYFFPAYRIEEIDGEVKSFTRDPNYFLFHKDSVYGYFIKHLDTTAIPERVRVDSIRSNRGFHNEYRTKGMKYVKTSWYTKYRFTEKYEYDGQNPNMYDSVYYSFDKTMNELPYSFSLGLDSIKGARMFRAQVIFNEKFHQNYKKTLPRIEYSFQFSETENRDPATFLKVRDWLRKNGVGL